MASPQFFYFSYGSNMNGSRMIQRGAYFTDRCVAKLKGYRFLLNKQRKNGTAAANIIPDATSEVFGALYTCNEDTLKALDKFEGVGIGHYRRESISVELNTGEQVEAVTYIANSHVCNDCLNTVDTDYLEHILQGRDILPNSYVCFLEGFRNWCKDGSAD